MLTKFHREITRGVLSPHFTNEAVEIALRANDEQDNLRGQIGHPEYHVDNSVPRGYAYMLAQKKAALEAFDRGDCEAGMQSLGRCLHAVQDFYSHSNYVKLWLSEHGGLATHPASIQPLLDWTARPGLSSGRATLQEGLTYLPLVGPFFARGLTMPEDSHYVRNLDGPHRGPEFAFALEAARSHFQHIVEEVRDETAAKAHALPCMRQPETLRP
jgi:hypothetical protein